MIKAGILGSTGYAGSELTRLLMNHPKVKIEFLDSRSYEGDTYSNIYPNLKGLVDIKCSSIDLANPVELDNIDVLFCALPHGLSQKAVQEGVKRGIKVIDLSADFRISNPSVYEDWYNVEHKALHELKTAVYGLTEIHRENIKTTQLVANPGCYPTSILLAVYPLLKEKLILTEMIIADSKSGVSGAGRNPIDATIYAQCNESVKAYSLGTHRHTPEIEQELSLMAGGQVLIQFTPHLIPMTRGILSTIYVMNSNNLKEKDLVEIYHNYYKNENFIRVLTGGQLPQTKAVVGSNLCDIGFKVDERTGKIILVSAIDNLIKGASGQAVQNMNVMFGIEEMIGLQQMPLWP
ncbi:N-acetyl-gamma-glutamyl-phosphate reductase [Alkaliphilus transvaalensis]|uniref:N-acetyl-gamma-glutamyl-phosphate reductase n=1 Tax=Alkaliphilus transvaalensis TaxID=114628 RepID=UPI00047AE8A4|nr:N-acetyl-gamma-glutamyl-phosphate reductase [Alkaliphilus transvaalensis]